MSGPTGEGRQAAIEKWNLEYQQGSSGGQQAGGRSRGANVSLFVVCQCVQIRYASNIVVTACAYAFVHGCADGADRAVRFYGRCLGERTAWPSLMFDWPRYEDRLRTKEEYILCVGGSILNDVEAASSQRHTAKIL